MKVPTRPVTVPEDAFWNEKEKEWQRGEWSGKHKKFQVGRWEFWRADGTLCCVAHFDKEGLLDGMFERYHEDGNLAVQGPYRKGHRGGHFVYIQSKNKTSEHYPADDRTWRHEFDSNRNWEEHGLRWFLEDGTECTSDGRPLSLAHDLDSFFDKVGPDNFLNEAAEKISRALGSDKQASDTFDLAELWGNSQPHFDKLFANLHETASLGICSGRRKFEPQSNLWQDLISYPWANVSEELASIFMGAAQIGNFGDSDGIYATLFNHKWKDGRKDVIYIWSHETYAFDDVIALNYDDFAYRVAVSAACEQERLSKKVARKAWSKLAGRMDVEWAASSGLQFLVGDDDEEDFSDDDDDFSDDAESTDDDSNETDGAEGDGEETTPLKQLTRADFNSSIDPEFEHSFNFWRCHWILQLLLPDDDRCMDTVRKCFRPGFNKSLDESQHQEKLETAKKNPTTACYLLWRYFWFKQDDRLKECCDVFRGHAARVLRDLVALIDDINAGKVISFDGSIENILAVRDEFLELDLCPERQAELQAARKKADSDKAAKGAANLSKLKKDAAEKSKLGLDALLKLAWEKTSDLEGIKEIESLVRQIPGYEMQWKAFDWIYSTGYVRDQSEYKEEAQALSRCLGKRNTRILQPFIWARVKTNYPNTRVLFEGLIETPGVIDARIEKLLIAELEKAEEYHHVQELSLMLLASVNKELGIERAVRMIDGFFAEVGKLDPHSFDFRLKIIPWKNILQVCANVLKTCAQPLSHYHHTTTFKSLRKLFSLACDCGELTLASETLYAILAWQEYNIMPCVFRLLHGVDQPERWAAMRTLEILAPMYKDDDEYLDELLKIGNPDDGDNCVTVLHHSAMLALSAMKKENKPELASMTEVMELADELGSYGTESWREWYIIQCQVVGKFEELALSRISRYLYSDLPQVREAAEKAYSARGVEAPQRRALTWLDVWETLEKEPDLEKAASLLAGILSDPNSVQRTPLAAWFWMNPSAIAAEALAKVVSSELESFKPIGNGDHLSEELLWLIRSLARHADYPVTIAVLEKCFDMDDEGLSGAVIQDLSLLPPSMAPKVLKIALNVEGWNRHYIAKWAVKHINDPIMAATLKELKITDKKLAKWAS